MAILAVQPVVRAGLNPTLVAAAGGGDSFPNTGQEFVYIKNDDAAPKTLTLDILLTVDGQPVTDKTVNVPAGEIRLVGPFPTNIYNDANGRVSLTYSAVTSVTIGIVSVPPAG